MDKVEIDKATAEFALTVLYDWWVDHQSSGGEENIAKCDAAIDDLERELKL
jgi:hypothetical protein